MNNALALFKLLADDTRLKILRALAEKDMYVELLAERLRLSAPTVSFHLKKLLAAGLVDARREQYYTVYSLRRKMRKAFRDTRSAIAEINASLESSISGIRVTKAFTNAEKEKEKFEVGNEKFKLARKDSYSAMGRFHSGNTFVTDIFNVVVLIAGGLFLYNGQIQFGDYSAFIVSINMLI